MSRLNATARGGIIGAVIALLVCGIVLVWAHFVFDLDVTTEQDKLTIPKGLVGKRFDAATAELKALGFIDVRAPRAAYAFGTASKVQSVIPPPGAEVDKDSAVTLISKLGSR
jgi:beta-lactam-binding protein with PASTA domain